MAVARISAKVQGLILAHFLPNKGGRACGAPEVSIKALAVGSKRWSRHGNQHITHCIQYAILVSMFFSIIPYKTPHNSCPLPKDYPQYTLKPEAPS